MAGQPKENWSPPDWLTIYLMAKDLGIPPWQVEEECSLEWFQHWSAFKEAEAQERKRLEQKANKKPLRK
jgi:hypothetical protein